MAKKGKAKPDKSGIAIEKSGVFRERYHLRPPTGYKWELFSYGRFGLTVILSKCELEADQDGG